MVVKSYGQRCPVTRTLDVIGDRWTLLVVRDLLDGPRRFSELKRSLVGVSPTLLSARLDVLQAEGVVERADAGYRLTDRGERLAPVVHELGRWGIELMDADHGAPDDVFHDFFRRFGFRVMVRPEVWPDRTTVVEADIDGERSVLTVAPRSAHPRIRIEAAGDRVVVADARIVGRIGDVVAARRGDRTLAELEEAGRVQITGRPWAVRALRASLTAE